MKFSIAVVAAYMAATATALPVGESEAVQRGSRVINTAAAPAALGPRGQTFHIIDKTPVPERRQKDTAKGMDDAATQGGEYPMEGHALDRREKKRPIVDHRPVQRRGGAAAASAAGAGGAVASSSAGGGRTFAQAFWGMPIINHIPYPGKRRHVEPAAVLTARNNPFHTIDHTPSP